MRDYDPNSTGGTGADGPERESPPGMPRWVKVSGAIALALLVLLVFMMIVSPGGHGPGRHLPSRDAGSPASSEAGPR